MSEALFGFLGVILGTLIPWIRESLRERELRKKHGEYLAIKVVCILDEYVQKCCQVVGDDGTSKGQAARRDENGQDLYIPQIPLPDPPIYPNDVDWKSISGGMMYRLLALKSEGLDINNYIQYDCDQFPPFYDDLFEARKKGYSELGLTALALVEELRNIYMIPKKENEYWDPKEFLEGKKKELEESIVVL